MTCEQCRQQLLPFLYDLLETSECDALAAHLESCADCTGALATATEQKGLLADAVKEKHADVVFQAPTKSIPSSSATTVAMPRRSRRAFLLNRWAAAAAILIVLFSAGSVVAWSIWQEQTAALAVVNERFAQANEDLGKSQSNLDQKKGQTQREILAIQEQIDALFGSWKQEEGKTRKVLEKDGAQLILKGPVAPQAGANTTYEIEWRQNAGQQQDIKGAQNPTPVSPDVPGGMTQRVNVRVFNQRTQDTLFEQQVPLRGYNAQANFVLPSKLPIKPNEDIALEFQLVDAAGKLITLSDNLKLVAPEYVTHLTTDRPLYRPGDTVRFRSLTLDRFSLKPAEEKFHLRYRIVGSDNKEVYQQEVASSVIRDGNNEAIKGPTGEVLHCLGVGEFALPADLIGGPYTLSVAEANDRFPEEKRTFLVQRLQPSRFLKELQFQRSSYAPGDQLKIEARVTPVQAAPGDAKDQSIPVQVRVVFEGAKNDLQQIIQQRQVTAGVWETFEFIVERTDKGVGTVVLECGSGVQRESLVREIPLVVRDVQVELFPESGDLIAGVNNRIYFQARTPADKPTELEGRILDDKNLELARVRTESDQGLGLFSFTPEPKRRYRLVVDSPVGVDRNFPLPEAKEQGVILTIPDGVFDGDIAVDLMSVDKRRVLLVGAYCRGRMLDHQFVRAGASQPVAVTLRPTPDVGGVYRITVFDVVKADQDIQFRPLAERLVYRKSAQRIDVAVTPDRPWYQPGDRVRLKLEAMNEKRRLIPTIGMLAVVDRANLKQADDKTARSMPTHFLLTTEIRNPEDLENADVLLSDHPKAAAALDLLLGCQGWRRFAEQDPTNFKRGQQQANNRQQVNPNFLTNSIVVTQFFETEQQKIAKLDQGYVVKAIDLEKKLALNESQETGPEELRAEIATKQEAVKGVTEQVLQTERRLREVRAFLVQFALGGGLLTLLFIGFYLVSTGLRRLSDGNGNPRPWFLAGLGLFGILFIASIIGTFSFMGEPLVEDFREGQKGFAVAVGAMAGGMPAPPPADPVELVADDDRAEAPKVADEPAKNDFKEVDKVVVRQDIVRQDVNARANLANFANANFGNGQNLFVQGNNNNNNDAPAEDRQLREQGNYQALLLNRLGRRVLLPGVNDPCIVREYAHQRPPQREGQRRDVADTVYWHPVLVMPDGKADVSFELPDTVTNFQVLVYSNSVDGRLGSNRAEIVSKLPLRIETYLPNEVSSQDQIVMPVELRNERPQPGNATVSARIKGMQLVDAADRPVNLADKEIKREMFHLKAKETSTDAIVRIVGKQGNAISNIDRRLRIVPDGFPTAASVSGTLDGRSVDHEIALPSDVIPGSVSMQAYFYPSPVAELRAALQELQSQPALDADGELAVQGLNVLLVQLMKAQVQHANPILERRARQELLSMQERLAATPGRPFSALGVLQLRELAKIQDVDADWLERGERLLSVEHAPKGIASTALRVWVRSETGETIGADELKSLREHCKTSKDPRFVALVALSHLNSKQDEAGVALMQQVSAHQQGSGAIAAGRGHEQDIEATSLAILGWLKASRPWQNAGVDGSIQSAVSWLGKQRRGAGSYGSPQATLLALKALTAYQQRVPRDMQAGELSLTRVGVPLGGAAPADANVGRVSFSGRSQDPHKVYLADATSLGAGKHTIHMSVTGNTTIPYTLTWSYRTGRPANDAAAPVNLTARLDRDQAEEGGTVKLTAVITNATHQAQDTAVAILGLPAGLVVREVDLKALQVKGKIAAWDLRGRELAVRWRNLAAKASVQLELDLQCQVPGAYHGPASRAYAGTASEKAFWIDPLSIRIQEKR